MSRVKQSKLHSQRPRTRRRATQAGRLADQERIRKGRSVRYDSPIREITRRSNHGVESTVTRRIKTGSYRMPRGAPTSQLVASPGVLGMMARFKRQKD